MSITRQTTAKSEKERAIADKAMADFLAKGGKVQVIPAGLGTDAADMKYKFRRPAPKNMIKDDK